MICLLCDAPFAVCLKAGTKHGESPTNEKLSRNNRKGGTNREECKVRSGVKERREEGEGGMARKKENLQPGVE